MIEKMCSMDVSSEMAEAGVVVVSALIEATALYHGVAGHKEAPSNASQDRTEHKAGTARASCQRVVLFTSFLTPSFVATALPVKHFTSILL
jgi:hypothetical protein